MEDIDKTLLTVIFGWTWRRAIRVFSLSCAASLLIFGGLALLPSADDVPPQWWHVILLSVVFGCLATCGALFYFRFVKGPATLARLRSKGKTEELAFCETLTKPNKPQERTSQ